jgi:outer membrane protein OmpA-like peptidoglycan-associated protein
MMHHLARRCSRVGECWSDAARSWLNPGRLRRIRITLSALVIAALSGPRAARAQATERLAVHVEGGLAALLSSPYSDAHGLGFNVAARPAVRLVGPLWLHLTGAYARWSEGANGPATLWTLGGGLTVAPVVSPRAGRLVVQAEAGYGLTGAAAEGRVVLGGGIGWMIPLGRSVIELGPVLRVGAVLPDGTPGASAALSGTANLTVGIRAPLHRLSRADQDRDGVDDADDRCPAESAGANPDAARPGCPLFDRDADGVNDAQDLCPDAPAGPRADAQRPGCPVQDTDADGVPDSADRCPQEREDTDGFEDTDGCPETDNDRDGIADTSDRCPDGAELMNGFEDDDGCPDDPPALVVPSEGVASLREPPRFAPGAAEVLPASQSALNALVEALNARADVRRVTVLCHAEAPGDRDAVRLARRRANALADYLNARGLTHRARARGTRGDPPGLVRIDVEQRAGRDRGHHRRRHR